jgi:hypothetical protein
MIFKKYFPKKWGKNEKTFHNNKKMIFKKYFPKKWGKKVKNFLNNKKVKK